MYPPMMMSSNFNNLAALRGMPGRMPMQGGPRQFQPPTDPLRSPIGAPPQMPGDPVAMQPGGTPPQMPVRVGPMAPVGTPAPYQPSPYGSAPMAPVGNPPQSPMFGGLNGMYNNFRNLAALRG